MPPIRRSWRRHTKQRKQAIIAKACGIIAALCVFAYTATIQSEASIARASAIRAYGGDRVEVLVSSKTIAHRRYDRRVQHDHAGMARGPPAPGAGGAKLRRTRGHGRAERDSRKRAGATRTRGRRIVAHRRVPDGLAAASVASDDVLAVGGAIRAGSVVDV